MYRIGVLINKVLKEKNISRYELVKRIGYKNTGKGLNRLDALIRFGNGNEFIYTNLPTALGITEIEVKEALILTHEEIKKERQAIERQYFKPHLIILTENDMPSSIWVVAITGGFKTHKTIQLPDDILEYENDEQLEILKGIITRNFIKREGTTHFFGKILGYIFCKSYDQNPNERLTFNTSGEIDNSISKHFFRPDPDKEGIFHKGKRLPFLIPFFSDK